MTAVGDAVSRHGVGDRVGVGCMVDSCRECANCQTGDEQYCLSGNTQTYASPAPEGGVTQGGYSTQIVVDEDFALSLPAEIPFKKVAPLLCAGVTTYSPLRHWGVGPGKKVAIIGLGGLGHLAVKIAAALGAEVTVLSRTLSKKDDGLAMGAHHYYATSDPATFEELAGTFDVILNTISADIDWNDYLSLLTLNGALIALGASPTPITISEFTLQNNRRTLAASTIGSIAETQEMLNFCATHGIAPEVEVIGADQVNEAWDRVLKSDVRFRFVIDISTLKSAQ